MIICGQILILLLHNNNGKKYNAKIVRNNSIRMRLELIIEEA